MLKNKVAVITGGSRGIGRAITLALAKNNADVAVIYSGDDLAAEQVVIKAGEYGVKAECFKCNVSDYGETEKTVSSITAGLGAPDILINNAGITRDKLIAQMDENDFDDVIDVNLKGAFNMIRHLYRSFIRKRYGRIINITSVSGMMGNAGQANYSSSKAGLIGLTKSTARELASRGVTCNAIAPGFIETAMTEKLTETIKTEAVKNIPLGRMGKPEEIAELVVFLASDAAGYITGELIKVDGGLYI